MGLYSRVGGKKPDDSGKYRDRVWDFRSFSPYIHIEKIMDDSEYTMPFIEKLIHIFIHTTALQFRDKTNKMVLDK